VGDTEIELVENELSVASLLKTWKFEFVGLEDDVRDALEDLLELGLFEADLDISWT
jgi:hypothetical protein